MSESKQPKSGLSRVARPEKRVTLARLGARSFLNEGDRMREVKWKPLPLMTIWPES